MKHLRTLLAVAAIGCFLSTPALADPIVSDRHPDGSPFLIKGDLGFVTVPTKRNATGRPAADSDFAAASRLIALDHLTRAYGFQGGEDLEVSRWNEDGIGGVHVRFDQRIDGHPVVGGEAILHADAATGKVTSLQARLHARPSPHPEARLDAKVALETFRGAGNTAVGEVEEHLGRAWAVDSEGRLRAAWGFVVARSDLIREEIYLDAVDGRLLERRPLTHHAKSWRTYRYPSTGEPNPLPGILQCDGDEPCSPPDAARVHDNVSVTYDFYSAVFGRDSYDGAGSTIVATYDATGNFFNGAFWLTLESGMQQAVFGRGNGSTFRRTIGDALDVVAHEITHGVTRTGPNLVGCNEPGALNEAFSDIMGAMAEAWHRGSVSADTWKIAEDVFTPGTAGDALRYMSDPTRDGVSRDYYPERVPHDPSCSFLTGRGGIHLNNGIVNLAFYLLSEGGTHPRGKTQITVQGVGIEKARAIFYHLHQNYFLSTTDFRQAYRLTLEAGVDLILKRIDFNIGDVMQALRAWEAVGVTDRPPVPTFTASCNNLTCTFDASASSDEHGEIERYAWQFGDGTSGQSSGPTITKAYVAAGWFDVRLTVTDDVGFSAELVQEVAVPGTPKNASQGLWWNPNRSGHGIDLERNQAGSIVMTWFTYRANGDPIWYQAQATPSGALWEANLVEVRDNGTSSTSVGQVRLSFSGPQNARFAWNLDGTWRSEAFQRFVFSSGAARPARMTGLWFQPEDPGWGFAFDTQGSVTVATVFFYDSAGRPSWVQGIETDGNWDLDFPFTFLRGVNLCPTCSGSPSVASQGAGAGRVRRAGSGFQASVSISTPLGTWTRPFRTIIKLAGP